MKTRSLLLVLFAMFVFAMAASAQQVDIGFGVSAVKSASSLNAATNYSPQTIGGGTFPTFSGDFLLHKNLGVEGEVSWRVGQNLYAGYQPFRPIFWNFNGIWVPRLGKTAALELMAGIGAESVRFYNNYYTCSAFSGCTNYTSENHFMGDVGAGLRVYVHGGLFVRPEARLYLIHGNNDFSAGWASRLGASIGYSFGGH